MLERPFRRGDLVVFRKSKQTPNPGPRAKHIDACQKGDNYSYVVDKFWIVDEVRANDQVVLRTRRGKVHVLATSDPHLRRATWLDRLLYRSRFPQLELTSREVASSAT